MLQSANIVILTFLTHEFLKLTIVSVKIYHFLYQSSNWRIFIFCTLGTVGLKNELGADLKCIKNRLLKPSVKNYLPI